MAVALHDVLRFSEFLLRFQEVIRELRIPRRRTKENDTEHSYQLAMMAWYIIQAGQLELNLDLVLKYALVHDIAEVYAGDVCILDHTRRAGKAEREAAALARIEAEFPDFPDLVAWVHRYEARADAESQFIYTLDKLMPMLIAWQEGGTTWREMRFSMEELLLDKDSKTAACPTIQRLWQELHMLIRQRPELFLRP